MYTQRNLFKALLVVVLCWQAFPSQAQYYQARLSVNPPNYDFLSVSEIQVENGSSQHVVLSRVFDPNTDIGTMAFTLDPNFSPLGSSLAWRVTNPSFLRDMQGMAFEQIGNDYLIAGNVWDNNANRDRLWIMRTNATTGVVTWSNFFGNAPTGLRVADLAFDGNNNAYILGTYGNPGGFRNIFLARVNVNTGALVWSQIVGDPNRDEAASEINFYSNSRIFVTGITANPNDFSDRRGLIFRFNSNGFVSSSSPRMIELITPQSGNFNHRLRTIHLERVGNYLYLVGQAVIGPSDPGPFFLLSLNINMTSPIWQTYLAGLMQIEDMDVEPNQILLGGLAAITFGNLGNVMATFDLGLNFQDGRNYTNIPQGSVAGTARSLYTNTGEAYMITDNNSGDLFSIKARADLRNDCNDPILNFPGAAEVVQISPYSLVTTPLNIQFSRMSTHNLFVEPTSQIQCFSFLPPAKRAAEATNALAALETDNYQVFPNPTQGLLEIQAPAEVEMARIEVLDLQGRQVFLRQEPASSQLEIDLSSLSKGIYLLRITDKDGNRFQQKVTRS